jgi:hypothetical protein
MNSLGRYLKLPPINANYNYDGTVPAQTLADHTPFEESVDESQEEKDRLIHANQNQNDNVRKLHFAFRKKWLMYFLVISQIWKLLLYPLMFLLLFNLKTLSQFNFKI